MAEEHLDRLLAELGERARAEIAATKSAGEIDAAHIVAQARSDAEQRQQSALADCDAVESKRLAMEIAAARRRSRGALLEAQHRFVDRSLARAKELVAERLAAASPGALEPRIESLMSYTTGLDAHVERGVDGVRISADGGKLRIDDTVDAWLARNRAELAIVACRAIDAAAANDGERSS